MKISMILVLSCMLIMGSGCSVMGKMALRSAKPVLNSNLNAFLRENDLQFAKDSLPAHIKLLEGLHEYDSDNSQLSELLARSLFSYAFGFIEPYDTLRAGEFYKRGVDAALHQFGGFQLFLATPIETLKNRFVNASEKAKPIWFWAALNFSAYANLNKSNPDVLSRLPFIEFLAAHIIKMDPSFYYGGAHLMLAASYASLPKILGGKMELAKEHFESALNLSDRKFLPVHYYFIKYYCINNQDIELARSLIQEVLNFDVNTFVDERLANTIVKDRIRQMNDAMDQYFLMDDLDSMDTDEAMEG